MCSKRVVGDPADQLLKSADQIIPALSFVADSFLTTENRQLLGTEESKAVHVQSQYILKTAWLVY